jgi:hypothetical protein
MNTKFYYRSAIYLLSIALLIALFVWVFAKSKVPILSLAVLEGLGVFAFIVTGLSAMWFDELLSELSRDKCHEGYPPFYRLRPGKTAPLQAFLWMVSVLA